MLQSGRYKRNRLLLRIMQHLSDDAYLLNREIGISCAKLLVLKV